MNQQDTTQAPATQTYTGLFASVRARGPRILAVTALAVSATFVGLQFLPQRYQASLDLHVPDDSVAALEADILLSQSTLIDVLARLPDGAVSELSPASRGVLASASLLRQRLVVKPGADDNMLHLSVSAESAASARLLANAIAASHAELSGQPLPASLVRMAVPEGEDAVPAKSPVVAAAEVSSADADISSLQQKLSLAWEERIRLESRAERIDAMIADNSYQSLALDADGMPGLGRRLDELATLEAERERLAIDLLPNHPTMRTVLEQIQLMEDDVQVQVLDLAMLAQQDLRAAQQREDDLRTQVTAASAPVQVDNAVSTGAISDSLAPKVVALPRPVRTDLALALVGGLTFFGQLGLIALLRPRRPEEVVDASEPVLDDMSPVEDEFADDPQPLPQTPVVAPARVVPPNVATVQHNWLDTAANAPVIPVAAMWLGDTQKAAPEPVPSAKPLENPSKGEKKKHAELRGARIIAVRVSDIDSNSDDLVDLYRRQQKRVVLIDAASCYRSRALGISDLATGEASFADIVHGSGINAAARIPWGRQARFDPSARPVRILVKALAELYDVVIITLNEDHIAAAGPLVALADAVVDPKTLHRHLRRAA